MAVLLWLMGLALLLQGCLCSVGQINRGCMKWAPSSSSGNDVCCEICHPGNRLVKKCGPKPQELCTPCEPNSFTESHLEPRCQPCTQCVGAQVLVKECTPTQDTTCGCKEGLLCGDKHCTFCRDKCNRGQEPTDDRSCRTCPNGTFNNQTHQKCKPWSTKCPNPDEIIVDQGDVFTDIKCIIKPQHSVIPPDDAEQTWPLIVSGFACFLMFISIIIITVMVKMYQTKKIKKAKIPKSPIIRTPTDDPRTLIAIECSFHEAEQEQGSTGQLLTSSDSTKRLII